MEMTLRWYGPGYDSVTLKQIRQIPGVKNVITTLFGKQAGELWLPKEIAELKKIVNDAGLGIAGIESVNVSDDIKIGTAKRDEHIDNYIKTLQALGEADIHMVCYNFMPVFDWTRTELARVRPDGSTVLAYNQDTVDMIDPEHMRESVEKMSNGFVMPGWEPERFLKCTGMLMQKSCLIILYIFWKQSDRYVKSMILKWEFIRMIRHGRFLASQEL